MKKIVYISSTYIDLMNYRAAVITSLERAGFDCESMEKYSAFDERPLDKCLADVAGCDYYLLILAWRYGYQPKENNPDNWSITQLEYRQAYTSGKHCLVFLLDTDHPWRPSWIDRNFPSAEPNIEQFRQLVGEKHGLRYFTTPDNLAKSVMESLQKIERQHISKDELGLVEQRSRYLEWLRAHCESVELLGLDLKENQNVRLGQIYVPAVIRFQTVEKGILLHVLGDKSLYLPVIQVQVKLPSAAGWFWWWLTAWCRITQ